MNSELHDSIFGDVLEPAGRGSSGGAPDELVQIGQTRAGRVDGAKRKHGDEHGKTQTAAEAEPESAAVQLSVKLASLAARASCGTPTEAQRKALEGEYEHLKMELRQSQGSGSPGAGEPSRINDPAVKDQLREIDAQLRRVTTAPQSAVKKAPGEKEQHGGAEHKAQEVSSDIQEHAKQGIDAQANVPGEEAVELLV